MWDSNIFPTPTIKYSSKVLYYHQQYAWEYPASAITSKL